MCIVFFCPLCARVCVCWWRVRDQMMLSFYLGSFGWDGWRTNATAGSGGTGRFLDSRERANYMPERLADDCGAESAGEKARLLRKNGLAGRLNEEVSRRAGGQQRSKS